MVVGIGGVGDKVPGVAITLGERGVELDEEPRCEEGEVDDETHDEAANKSCSE